MKKRLLITLLIIFTVALSATVLAACNDDKTDTSTSPELTYAEFTKYPKKYYEIGEAFDATGGNVLLTYSDGSTKNVDTAREDIVVTHNGTAVERLNVATLAFDNLRISYTYYVSKVGEGIESVILDFPKDTSGAEIYPTGLYAKSSLPYRTYPELNGLLLVVKYRNSTKNDLKINLSETSYYDVRGIDLTNWDCSAVGERNMIFTYLATDLMVPYKVLDEDWITKDGAIKVGEESMRLNYVVGEDFDPGSFYIQYIYHSGASLKCNISVDHVFDFDTSTAGTRTMYIGTPYLDESYTYQYTVYEETAVQRVGLVTDGMNINVDDTETTYDEWLASYKLELVMDDGAKVPVTGATEGMSAYIKKENGWEIFDETAFDEIKYLGKEYQIDFEYMGGACMSETYGYASLKVMKSWTKTVVTGWQDVFTVTKDGTFDFGEATLQKFYNDGTSDEVISIQAEYEKAKAERLIDINDLRYREVQTIDTSTVGEYVGENYKYLIVVMASDGLWINGAGMPDFVGERLHIDYKVVAAE